MSLNTTLAGITFEEPEFSEGRCFTNPRTKVKMRRKTNGRGFEKCR